MTEYNQQVIFIFILAGECIACENPRENIIKELKPMLMTVQEICKSAEEERYKASIRVKSLKKPIC